MDTGIKYLLELDYNKIHIKYLVCVPIAVVNWLLTSLTAKV